MTVADDTKLKDGRIVAIVGPVVDVEFPPDELITKLSRVMNRARQDSITNEIMEIVGGAEALGGSKGDDEDLLDDNPFARDLFPQKEHTR